MSILVKSPRAELDLINIWDYIADDSLDRADEFLARVEGKLQTLARNPGMGRRREELLPGLQSFPIGNYVVFYRVIEESVGADGREILVVNLALLDPDVAQVSFNVEAIIS